MNIVVSSFGVPRLFLGGVVHSILVRRLQVCYILRGVRDVKVIKVQYGGSVDLSCVLIDVNILLVCCLERLTVFRAAHRSVIAFVFILGASFVASVTSK